MPARDVVPAYPVPNFYALLLIAPGLVTEVGGVVAKPVPGFDGQRYALVCASLVLLLAGIGYALRKVARGAWSARASKRSLAVLDVLPLGGSQRLAVVRCYDRTLVLGLGDKTVSLVVELDAEAREQPVAP
ncbi:MAG TPA: flagellar biosynthetic protein FliO, partial [Planctomycetota bacterium]|nr:flagellar biosynthetic protein FliO [Planctomycetota bacterium]